MEDDTDAKEDIAGLSGLIVELAWTYRDVAASFESYVGMSRARAGLLGLLARQDKISQTDLQRLLGLDRSSITRHVKALEEDGLIVRHSDPQDNRFTLVALTETGRALIEDISTKGKNFDTILFTDITQDDAEVMLRCMRRLRTTARKANESFH